MSEPIGMTSGDLLAMGFETCDRFPGRDDWRCVQWVSPRDAQPNIVAGSPGTWLIERAMGERLQIPAPVTVREARELIRLIGAEKENATAPLTNETKLAMVKAVE